MQLTTIRVLYRKEMTEAIRDWRALVFAILIPILLGPLVMLVFGIGAKISARRVHNEVLHVIVLNAAQAPALADSIREDDHMKIVSPPENESYLDLINKKQIQAVVEIPANFDKELQKKSSTGSSQQDIPIYYYSGEWRSEAALNNLQQIIRNYRDEIVASKLTAAGVSASVLSPFDTHPENVAESSRVAGQNLSGIISFLIILYCFMGAVGPAVEQTIAQKERGFVESVLARPISRVDLAVAKFLVVLTTALTTAIVSILSIIFALRLQSLYTHGDKSLYAIRPEGIIMCLGIMIPLALLFSALALALALQARSSKEANAYLSPLLGVAGVPALIGMMPGMELNLKTAMIPILNISLSVREILTGNFPIGLIALAVIASCAYAAAAIAWAASSFNKEFALFR